MSSHIANDQLLENNFELSEEYEEWANQQSIKTMWSDFMQEMQLKYDGPMPAKDDLKDEFFRTRILSLLV
tara:strand:- start:234 stop:443 length:210 start_codon:yes stop_codon:yes gene_type:complete